MIRLIVYALAGVAFGLGWASLEKRMPQSLYFILSIAMLVSIVVWIERTRRQIDREIKRMNGLISDLERQIEARWIRRYNP